MYPLRVKVTQQLVDILFKKGDAFSCVIGIPDGYKCIGVIQDALDGSYYFMFNHPECFEGAVFQTFVPLYKKHYLEEEMFERIKELALEYDLDNPYPENEYEGLEFLKHYCEKHNVYFDEKKYMNTMNGKGDLE